MSFAAEQDIMLEEEADRRRVVEEQHLAEYVAVVKQQRADEERDREQRARRAREEHQQEARGEMVGSLNSVLRIEVSVDRVRIVETGEVGWYPEVFFGGVTFAKPYVLSSHRTWRDRELLYVARPCTDCGQSVWVEVSSSDGLVTALESEHRHDHACLQQFDEDGEPITDRRGNPLPERKVVYKPSAEEQHRQAAEKYAGLVKLRRELEFKRPIEKAAAIKRLIDSQLAKSATAAKEMSHEDPDFAQFCQTLTDTVIAEMEARETLFVARKNAGISGAGASSAGDEEESA